LDDLSSNDIIWASPSTTKNFSSINASGPILIDSEMDLKNMDLDDPSNIIEEYVDKLNRTPAPKRSRDKSFIPIGDILRIDDDAKRKRLLEENFLSDQEKIKLERKIQVEELQDFKRNQKLSVIEHSRTIDTGMQKDKAKSDAEKRKLELKIIRQQKLNFTKQELRKMKFDSGLHCQQVDLSRPHGYCFLITAPPHAQKFKDGVYCRKCLGTKLEELKERDKVLAKNRKKEKEDDGQKDDESDDMDLIN